MYTSLYYAGILSLTEGNILMMSNYWSYVLIFIHETNYLKLQYKFLSFTQKQTHTVFIINSSFTYLFFTLGKNKIQCSQRFITGCFQDAKSSGALKKSSRYRSRSLSASSTDSYSSSRKRTVTRRIQV